MDCNIILGEKKEILVEYPNKVKELEQYLCFLTEPRFKKVPKA